ncbi:hypothetical protein GLOTRDRAFT_106780 [Gloeophyllum trabeum ATCC 11539]|uniref:DNA2/NAM7 helicase-like C-terminal domain-containing protein n=1 Tax=Gloeophyllum trabeum (strain ATCC 11539 / FP-39264 / Madison 617) TaxID=670483 RepID=S7Q2V6_GLOTA|nr:uncharacterized protein GLOTRDRAFT_106780 [Gloeophyllum trabeum ATCC 11539]EPQ54331.1 hypothetical protein GLOTRDRAFT_106780 [Gloeophyllum trabeum ATCC 11539]
MLLLGIWLVAHSNVAVKNIAEKLAGCDFLDFRLIVSHEFHFDWHEHLYHKISSNIIPSDQLPKDIVDTERRLGGARVILCTLSMLSNESLQKAGFNRLVPVHTVIVDEASQIEVGDYLPLLHNHDKSLKKLVFIGDDKQLYQGRLRSEHSDRALSSCRFVDVSEGRETKTGNSWQNVSEAREAIRIAAICQARGQAFRLITPYDAQRGLLEKLLKASGLPWQDKCFNVDSFQGNEEDNVIISCVRSQKIGFLSNLRRTNVMLSRCKRGMFVITSKQFLHGIASSSLMGKMAAEWGDEGWLSRRQILQGVL